MQQTQKLPLDEVFGDVKLNIPKYQRAYSWDEKQIREMFEDLLYGINNYRDDSEVYHYFGTIVLEEDGYVQAPMSEWDKYNVIDGQQRLMTTTILVRVIIKFLDKLSDTLEDDQIGLKCSEMSEELEKRYIKKNRIPKLDPEDLSREYYKRMIIKGESPDSVVNEDSPLVAHRIKNAIEIFNEMIKSELSKFEKPEDGFGFLREVTQTLSNDFKLTPNIMKNMNEASRMFKIVNERGKDISKMDKIKSHLMYVATETNDVEPEYVTEKINNAIRNVSKNPESTDSDIDDLADVHWIIFTGELSDEWAKNYDKYDEEYRKRMSPVQRLQEMPWYASVDRDSDGLSLFIKEYVDSLEEISSEFAKYKFLTDIDKKTLNTFYLMHNSGMQRKFEIYSMSVLYAFDKKSDNKQDYLDQALNEVRKPALMYNQIMNNSGSYDRVLAKLGHQAFWCKWSDEPSDLRDKIFKGRKHAMWKLPTNEKITIEHIKAKIRNRNEDKNIEDTFRERLLESDIKDGEFTNGWGGVRSIDTIKILLYYYEKSMRSTTGKVNLPNLVKWCQNMQLEHMIPETPRSGEKVPHHNMQVNKLGNFITLSSTDNQTASNKKYEKKKKEKYDKLNLKMSEELPNEAKSDRIEDRSKDIIDDVIKYM